jgi:hypothetical protein
VKTGPREQLGPRLLLKPVLSDNASMTVVLRAVRRPDGMLDYSKDGPGVFKSVLPPVLEKVEGQLRANNATQDEADRFIEEL